MPDSGCELEIRNPKSEIPNSESWPQQKAKPTEEQRSLCSLCSFVATAAFGLRTSDFLRISDFGFRISLLVHLNPVILVSRIRGRIEPTSDARRRVRRHERIGQG